MTVPRFPITLAIETSNPSAQAGLGVALGQVDGHLIQVLGAEPLSQATAQDDDLWPAIERLRARCGIHPRDITRIAISIGPGGYTALRIAVAAAKMLALVNRAEVIGIPSAQVIARRVNPSLGPFAVLLASKGDIAFATRFEHPEAPPTGSGRLIQPDDLPSLAVRALIADRFLPDAMRARAQALGLVIVPPILDPVACLEASRELPATAPEALTPLYAREPDAVTLWRLRHGSSR